MRARVGVVVCFLTFELKPRQPDYLILPTINIGVRAGGARGLQPPKVWATKIFWAAREIWAKPVFKEVSMFFFSKR